MPVRAAESMVTGAIPVEVNVTGSVVAVFTVTLPNATLAGLMVNVGIAAGEVCTGSIRLTRVFCSASGVKIPTLTLAIPEGRVIVLCSSVEEIKTVATLAPETCNSEAETKPEPRVSSKKLLPGDVCVTEPVANFGSGLRTLTLSEAEDAGFDSVAAPIVTE
jgi:hypothetical protein